MRITNGLPALDHELHALSSDVQELINATAGTVEDAVDSARKRLSTLVKDGERAYDQWGERAGKAAKKANAAIHDHPYQAVGVSLALGIIVGTIMQCRK